MPFPAIFSGLDNMTQSQRHSGFFKVVDLGEMIGVLEDLITYFAQPEDDLSEGRLLVFFGHAPAELTHLLLQVTRISKSS